MNDTTAVSDTPIFDLLVLETGLRWPADEAATTDAEADPAP
ncbi:hypothetical protein SAMN05421504_11391 [Amycolatopsis xylanica]|uniref:Uncharacterized protein n=1 Tax=Amycolatopsis xylanica TaxID=589385 RepID=A0A1H3SDJ4_9PSEU|nr:hypothetical protein [Amycolatopsis xylanica]SDZ35159.1 hypothetical protein SAMN05421504_11391 [Amycolatopsis xylanica]